MTEAQVRRPLRVFPGMAVLLGARRAHEVRCLDCETVYRKPVDGGTLSTNPGCPHCGYVGWAGLGVELTRASARRRSVWDRRPLRLARLR